MNAELLEKSIGMPVPEELDGTLDLQNGLANCCKFNRWGALVAVGSTDGKVFIFDFVTRGIVKSWSAHPHPISSLSWSRDGRQLMTASSDTTVAIWDVLQGTVIHRFKFGSMITSAVFSPRNNNQFIVVQVNCPPSVETIEPRSTKILTNEIPGSIEDSMSSVSYDKRSRYIITGTTKGKIIIYDAITFKVMNWCRQNSVQQIRQIIVSRRGDYILTNSQDRVIRSYSLQFLLECQKGSVVEPKNKVLDIVNKAAWKSVCSDADGHYICGASTKGHSLYLWERTGTLIKILHGTKGETLLDVQWHPTRPVLLSVANGIISVWTQAHVENWSAFAPDFTELEENCKYVEKEGEFDMEDEDAEEESRDKEESEDEDIDVVTMKPGDILCSSDEEADMANLMPDVTLKTGPLWFVPITPDIDNPEQTSNQMDVLARPSSQVANEMEDASRKRAYPGGKPGPRPRKSK